MRRPLRNFAIYSFSVTLMAAYWCAALPLVAAALLFPAPRRRHWMRWLLLGFGQVTLRVAWRPFFPVRYTDLSGGGREPGIVVVNHRAASDGVLVAALGLNAVQTVNGWPLRIPLIGWGAALAGYLDITGWEYPAVRARAAEVIGMGDMVIAFPEGTRSESRRMNPFHSGIFQVALDLGVPVYMLCVSGNEFMPDRRFCFREFREVRMRLLAPIPAAEVRRCASAYALKRRVFRRMEEELSAMDAESDGGIAKAG